MLHKFPKIFGIGASILLLIAMALQYPFSVTFPMGPDAPAHIRDALRLFNQYPGDHSGIKVLIGSPYPISVLLLNTMRTLPVSWPERFIGYFVFAHIAVGLALGFLLYRIHNWQASAISIALWAPLTATLNNQLISGTVPQLWSLVFLLLFLERLYSKSALGTVIFLFLVLIAHPVTAVITILALTCTLPILWLHKKRMSIEDTRIIISLSRVVIALYLFGGVAFISRYRSLILWDGPHFPFPSTLASPLAIILLLALFGIFTVQRTLKKNSTFRVIFNAFQLLTIALALSNFLYVDVFTDRFRAYFILLVIITASISLATHVRNVFSSTIIRTVAILTPLLVIALYGWNNNAQAYKEFVKSGTYHYFSADEMSASVWLKNNTPSSANIVSTGANRHSEWIPLISDRTYFDISSGSQIFSDSGDVLIHTARKATFSYIVFFTRREKVPQNIASHSELFEKVFQNNGAIIYKIIK